MSAFGVAAWRAAAHLRGVDLLYLHRLPLSQRTLPLLLAARRAQVPVAFDTDDLVWDTRDLHYSYLSHHYTRRQIARMLLFAVRMRLLMAQVQALVVSTDYLAGLARAAFRKPVFVHQNALSAEQLARSEAALTQQRAGDGPVIGYFSGTPRVHDEDMALVAPALARTLRQVPGARLRVYGDVTLSGALAGPDVAAQVERRGVVDWHHLPEAIAGVDVSIAPLVSNPQRRAKSAVKYLEAAAVGVPTVASYLEPYSAVMRHGDTGLLARDAAEWERALLLLADDAQARRQMGERARADALAHHTNRVRAAAFAAIGKTIRL